MSKYACTPSKEVSYRFAVGWVTAATPLTRISVGLTPGWSTAGKRPDGVEGPEPPVDDVDGCFDPVEPELGDAAPRTASVIKIVIARARIEHPPLPPPRVRSAEPNHPTPA